MALSGILQMSFAAEAREASAPSSTTGGVPPSTPPKRKGKRPRYPDKAPRPSFQTARADQKYYDDLDAGIPEPEPSDAGVGGAGNFSHGRGKQYRPSTSSS